MPRSITKSIGLLGPIVPTAESTSLTGDHGTYSHGLGPLGMILLILMGALGVGSGGLKPNGDMKNVVCHYVKRGTVGGFGMKIGGFFN
jgi:hypothetical protein